MQKHALERWLKDQSEKQLNSIIQEINKGIGCLENDLPTSNQNDLVNHILQFFDSEEQVTALYQGLHNLEQRVIQLFIFYAPDELISHRQFEQLAEDYLKPSSGVLYRLALIQLRRKGIILTYQQQWGEKAYFLQEPFALHVYTRLIHEAELESLLDQGNGQIEPVHELPPVLRYLVQCIDRLSLLSSKDRKLTKQGYLQQRVLEKLEEIVQGIELDLDLFEPFTHDKYSPILALLLEFLAQQNVLEKIQDEIRLNQQILQQLFACSNQELLVTFFQFLQKTLRPKERYAFRFWRDLGYGQQKGFTQWYGLLDWAELWEDKYSLPQLKQLTESFFRIVSLCHALGVVELEEREDQWYWRLSTVVEAPMQLWVQDNLECFCPGFLHLQDVHLLLQGTQIIQWDQMLVLKLDAEKLQALHKQHKLQPWLERIAAYAGMALQELQAMLKPIDLDEQVNLRQMLVLNFQNENVLRLFKEWLQQNDFSFTHPSSQLILIDPKQQEQTIEWLRQHHISVNIEEHRLDKKEQAEETKDHSLHFLQSSQVRQFPAPSTELPEQEEAIPAWSQLPELWKKQMIAYHDKVKRDIILKAIENQAYLKLELASGEQCQILPQDFRLDKGKDKVYGRDPGGQASEYLLEDLERLQILFPFLD